MKKVLSCAVIASTALTISFNAHAENTGCGLGTMIFDGNKGLAPNVLAVTTNGTSGNQTFGITSGTSGCKKNATVRFNGTNLFSFADKNLGELAQDSAKGEGEYLESAAQILDIKEEDKEYFFLTMQKNFSDIFIDSNANTSLVVASISKIMQQDKKLKSYKIV